MTIYRTFYFTIHYFILWWKRSIGLFQNLLKEFDLCCHKSLLLFVLDNVASQTFNILLCLYLCETLHNIGMSAAAINPSQWLRTNPIATVLSETWQIPVAEESCPFIASVVFVLLFCFIILIVFVPLVSMNHHLPLPSSFLLFFPTLITFN